MRLVKIILKCRYVHGTEKYLELDGVVPKSHVHLHQTGLPTRINKLRGTVVSHSHSRNNCTALPQCLFQLLPVSKNRTENCTENYNSPLFPPEEQRPLELSFYTCHLFKPHRVSVIFIEVHPWPTLCTFTKRHAECWGLTKSLCAIPGIKCK